MGGGDVPLSFAVRSGDLEVGILGSELVVRRVGLVSDLLAAVGLMQREQRLPLAIATAHYSNGVLRLYQSGQPWFALEGVSDHYVAIDLAAEVRRFGER